MTDFRLSLRRIARSGRRLVAPTLKHPALLTSILVTGLLLTVRQVGGLQPLELMAFDQMLRLRPSAGPDPRLLIVAITEEDIRSQNRWPISDEVVAKLLEKLQQSQPSVIGLDIYRDIPQPPGQADLISQLNKSNVITIKRLEDDEGGGVSPPPMYLLSKLALVISCWTRIRWCVETCCMPNRRAKLSIHSPYE